MNSVADVWMNVLTQLKRDLSETTIATWFDELEAVDIRDGVFYLFCPNDFKKNYIESLFMKNIKAVLHDIFSNDFEVKVLSADEYAEFTGGAKKKKSEASIRPRTTTPCSFTEIPAWARPISSTPLPTLSRKTTGTPRSPTSRVTT